MSLSKIGSPHSVRFNSNLWINEEKLGEEEVHSSLIKSTSNSVQTNLPLYTFRDYIDENTVGFGETKSDENHFEEVECGEPLQFQQLRMDFNPIPGVDDNPNVQQKCLDFWKFIRSRPDVQRFLAIPKVMSTSESEAEEEDFCEAEYKSSTLKIENELNKETAPSTAWMQKSEVLIGHAFATEMKTSCSFQSEYCEDNSLLKKKVSEYTKHSDENIISRDPSVKFSTRSLQRDAKIICKQLDEWDQVHPRPTYQMGHPEIVQNSNPIIQNSN